MKNVWPVVGLVAIVVLLFAYVEFGGMRDVLSAATTTVPRFATTTSMPAATTTTAPIEVDLNFTTPELRLNRTFFIPGTYEVYLNDTFLKMIDWDGTKGLYDSSMRAAKEAFSIWENGTDGLVDFEFVKAWENHTIYVEWTGEMPGDLTGQAIAYAVPEGYDCGTHWFITGGSIFSLVKEESSQRAIMAHEIGHLLNLADVGNKGSIMGGWYDEYNTPSAAELEGKITDGIVETLGLIIRPEYNCGE